MTYLPAASTTNWGHASFGTFYLQIRFSQNKSAISLKDKSRLVLFCYSQKSLQKRRGIACNEYLTVIVACILLMKAKQSTVLCLCRLNSRLCYVYAG